MLALPLPHRCRACGARGRVVATRLGDGYRRRRYWCGVCPKHWTTYETVLNPHRLRPRAVTARDRCSPTVADRAVSGVDSR